jgi:hypothetical protein
LNQGRPLFQSHNDKLYLAAGYSLDRPEVKAVVKARISKLILFFIIRCLSLLTKKIAEMMQKFQKRTHHELHSKLCSVYLLLISQSLGTFQSTTKNKCYQYALFELPIPFDLSNSYSMQA